MIADTIVRTLAPRRVLDAGCALGMIVESLWDRHTYAEGVDISEFAISNVRPDMKRYCRVASTAEPFNDHYDLIICIEVLEHMSHEDSEKSIKNFGESTDTVLFSSTPDDFEEITHVNVKPLLAWIELFSKHGFRPDVEYDAGYITPHAILFRKGDPLSHETVALFIDHLQLRQKNALNEKLNRETASSLAARDIVVRDLTDRCNELSVEAERSMLRAKKNRDQLTRVTAECERLQAALLEAPRSEAVSLPSREIELEHEIHNLRSQIAAITSSTSWRVMTPIRRLIGGMPAPVRYNLRRAIKAGYWAVTPHRTMKRIRFLRQRSIAAHVTSADSDVDVGNTTVVIGQSTGAIQVELGQPADRSLIIGRSEVFPELHPIPVYLDDASVPSVTILTDSVEPHSLFGGVATAIVFGAKLAEKLGCRLRLATRTSPPDLAVIGTVLRCHGINFSHSVEGVHANPHSDEPIPFGSRDIVLTTSWWTTWSASQSIINDRILYILQEDERMFYSHNERRLACSEILSDDSIYKIINTGLLFDHLFHTADAIGDGSSAIAFEPAFPAFSDANPIDRRADKLNFFFYARPRHERNLFWRGVEAIDKAALAGIFPSDRWNLHFVGSECPAVTLSDGRKPIVHRNLGWSAYTDLVRTMDLGLSLMYTPHPSYPPLDLAAAGAIVVTNRYGNKTSLADRSSNILMTDLSVSDIVRTMATAAELAQDYDLREANRSTDSISRSWHETLDPILDHVIRKFGR